MGEAIVRALLKSNSPEDILINDKDGDRLRQISNETNVKQADKEQITNADVVILAVKPQDIDSLDIKTDKIIISIMAGISIKKLKELTSSNKIVRVMPNLNTLVGASCSGYASKNLTDKEKASVKNILSQFGEAIEVDESLLDAVTGLSGSGPAYIAYMIKQLSEAGRKQGLSEEQAYQL